jgi:hypothetical protein
MRITHLTALALLITGSAVPLRAQGTGNGYLFGTPDVRLTLRGGYARASAHSDLFDDAIRFLTLERSSFSGPTLGGDLGIRVAPRLDLSLTADYAVAMRSSNDRVYIDNNDLPIEQTTTFRRVPLMANAILYLAPRGRSIGKLAWIPTKIVPWVGAGGGVMWYRFRQEGDFVDYQTLNVFNTTLESSGWAPAFQGLGGVDVTLTPRVAFTADARYVKAKASPSNDYRTYDKVDLSGITSALGFTIRL